MSSAASVSVGARLWMGRMLFAPVRCAGYKLGLGLGPGIMQIWGINLKPNTLPSYALNTPAAALVLTALDRGAASFTSFWGTEQDLKRPPLRTGPHHQPGVPEFLGAKVAGRKGINVFVDLLFVPAWPQQVCTREPLSSACVVSCEAANRPVSQELGDMLCHISKCPEPLHTSSSWHILMSPSLCSTVVLAGLTSPSAIPTEGQVTFGLEHLEQLQCLGACGKQCVLQLQVACRGRHSRA